MIMNVRQFVPAFFLSLLFSPLLISLLAVSEAQVRVSDNYQIQSDSLNVGGGLSNSDNFNQEATVGEVGTGLSDGNNYSLRAGYQQMQEVYIAMGVVGDVVMSPSLSGLTGGVSTGSTTVTVTTDGSSGYELFIVAEDSPAMQGDGDVVDDYEAGETPDYDFTIAGSEARFGFSPEGVDIVEAFLNDAEGICAQGGLDDPLSCWVGPSTTPQAIARASGANHPLGSTTTLQFMVKVGSGAVLLPGVYTATTTMTAIPL